MSAPSNRLAAIGFICALASPASAQLLNQKSLSAAMALTIAQTALETCTKQGYHVSVHVLGRNGEVIVAVRGDGASPHTAHSTNRVPLILTGEGSLRDGGELADIAPTVLALLGLEAPEVMSGKDLLNPS